MIINFELKLEIKLILILYLINYLFILILKSELKFEYDCERIMFSFLVHFFNCNILGQGIFCQNAQTFKVIGINNLQIKLSLIY